MGDQAITLADEHTSVMPDSNSSLELLFREHHEKVFLAAYRISGSTQDAEDVLQSVFLRLLKRSEVQNFIANTASYLCRAAINASLDIMRAKRVHRANLDDSSNQADPSAVPADSPVDNDAYRAELRRHLRFALSSLNPRAAEIFALRYFADFGNAEIAEMLDTSTSSIAVTLHRTRDRLQELLGEIEGESP